MYDVEVIHMEVLYFLLLLAGLVSFVAAAFFTSRVETHTRGINLVALGLAFWIAVPFIQAARLL